MTVTADRYCPQCGTLNVKPGNFCRECGSKFSDVSYSPTDQHTPNIKRKQNRLVGYFKKALEEQERQALEWYNNSDEQARAQRETASELIPPHVKKYVRRRDGGRCVYCGSRTGLDYHHIVPVSLGGSNTARNVQLSCERCSSKK